MMKFLFDGPIAILAIFLCQHIRQIPFAIQMQRADGDHVAPRRQGQQRLAPGEIALMHQHII